MRRLSTLVAALAIGFAVSSAQAIILPLDDFSAPGFTLVDAQGGGRSTSGVLIGGGFSRELTLEVLTPIGVGAGCQFACVSMGNQTFPVGLLNVANAANVDSEVNVIWDLAAGYVPLGSPVSFFFDIINSDGNPIQADLFIGATEITGVLAASFVIPSNTLNAFTSFGLTMAQQATLNAGGVLRLRLNGVEGWDLILDTVGFNIPEPTTLALAGLALLGAGVAARRRKV